MYVLKLEPNEIQLIQSALTQAPLNMEQSNLRGQLWQSMQAQLVEQMPKPAQAEDGEPKED